MESTQVLCPPVVCTQVLCSSVAHPWYTQVLCASVVHTDTVYISGVRSGTHRYHVRPCANPIMQQLPTNLAKIPRWGPLTSF